MNGKVYSLSLGMVFKKYYCSKCGARLEREKNHRVVTKDDPDYYRYHDFGKFPRRDYDVYDYRFRCPDCGARQSYDDQRIIARMQKRHGHPVLPASEIKSCCEEDKKKARKNALVGDVLLSLIPALISAVFFCLYISDKSTAAYKGLGITFLLFAAGMVKGAIRRYARSRQSRSQE